VAQLNMLQDCSAFSTAQAKYFSSQ